MQKCEKMCIDIFNQFFTFTSMKKLFTLTELSEYIGIKRRTLYNMLQDGRFPVPPVKGTDPRRWNIDAIDAWRSKK